jgi:hypothetical protein
MAFNNIPASSLSRFSIGEIAGLSGVPDFYNAGSSKWLKSGAATASSNLTTSTKTNLAAAGTASQPTVLVQSALSKSYNTSGPYATYPIARISASSVSVVPACINSSTDVVVGVVTAAGVQIVNTGQTSIRTASNSAGTNGFVASNNTKIFSYTFTSATALSVKSTTNGTTWTTETVSGLPVFNVQSTTIAHASQCTSTSNNTVAAFTGWKRNTNAPTQFAVFFCGARFVLLAPDGTNFVASLSTDGFTFSGDNTTAVLGSAGAAPQADDIQFYRNGNSCFLNVGGAYRFTTDGGVTWAASTFAAAPNPSVYFMQYNTTNPAKLIIQGGVSSSVAYYSADSGATWSANRALPNTAAEGGLYYKGSTVVFSTNAGIYKVSTDDGVTYTTPTFPVGVLSQNIQFYADVTRFYALVTSQAQVLTSTDAVTWTLVTLPQTVGLGPVTTQFGNGIVTYAGDTNTVALMGYNQDTGFNQCIFSLNGGVTWTGAQFTVDNTSGSWSVGNAFTTPDFGGIAFIWGMSNLSSGPTTNVFKSDLTAGGAFYRTGTTAITPVQANSFAYVRVA